MRGDRISFSQLLPLIDLALLVILVFVPITLTALRIYEASNGAPYIHLHADSYDLDLPRSQIIPWAIRMATEPRAYTVKAINFPGIVFDTLISLPTSWPSMWHPQALLLETWDALVYPFFALPFWWMVGCGLDVIFRKERLHWSLLLLGTLLCVVCLVCTLGFRFGLPAADRADSDGLVVGALGWTIGFAILPAAWIAQWMRVRRNREAAS
jgi:hypothetical protein